MKYGLALQFPLLRSPVSRQGVNLAAMARRAIDEVPLRIRSGILHFRELLIDGEMHGGHFARRTFRPLFVTREIAVQVTMRAGDSQGLGITARLRPHLTGFLSIHSGNQV